LREHNLELAIEVLGPLHRRREGRHELIWRLPEGAAFAASCGPAVGVLVDSWHWHHAGGTVDEIAALGDRILHVHLADAPDIPAAAIHDDHRLLPGDGVVDFVGFFQGLATAGYAGQITPEIRGYRCSDDPVDCARRALAAVRDVLDARLAGRGHASGHDDEVSE
jgi:sugar phosphate isomerase/epimerase